jgi:hypothetical protein
MSNTQVPGFAERRLGNPAYLHHSELVPVKLFTIHNDKKAGGMLADWNITKDLLLYDVRPPNVNRFAAASVPAFTCPPDTEMHILDLGTVEADEGW